MTAFVIVGAGAIGCHVGGRLTASGATVVFVARGDRAQSLRARGLTVAALDGYRAEIAPERLVVAETPAEAARFAGENPLVILATKAGATAEAAAAIGAAFPAGTALLSLQNGIDNAARIRAAAPHLMAIAGMVPFNVTLDGDADGRRIARRTTSGDIHAEKHPALAPLAPIFAKAGLPLTLVADMAPVQWGKLLLNLNNPVNALSGLPLRDELMDRDYRRALALLQEEALGLLSSAGIRPGGGGPARPHPVRPAPAELGLFPHRGQHADHRSGRPLLHGRRPCRRPAHRDRRPGGRHRAAGGGQRPLRPGQCRRHPPHQGPRARRAHHRPRPAGGAHGTLILRLRGSISGPTFLHTGELP